MIHLKVTVVFSDAEFIRDNLGNCVVKTKTMLCSGICRLVVQSGGTNASEVPDAFAF